ncbi:hypothetical protein MnTg02_01802 [bacterium MnTg02]|nr:hypothetical protein MnTg02_01802 [bacterium MnTg02]
MQGSFNTTESSTQAQPAPSPPPPQPDAPQFSPGAEPNGPGMRDAPNAEPGPEAKPERSKSADESEKHISFLHNHCENLGIADEGVLVLSLIEPDKKPRVSKFRIGDVDGMAAEVRGRATFANVYVGLHLMRKDLERGRRGKFEDIKAVFGLVIDDDADTDTPCVLPSIPPTLMLITSQQPVVNRQHFFFFTRALMTDEASDLAKLLHRKCGGDHGTKDVTHIWRIPGTLNHPNAAKIKRGRPAEPQPVKLEGVIGKAIDPEDLRRELEKMPDLHPPKSKSNGASKSQYRGGSKDRDKILAGLPGEIIDLIETDIELGDGDRSKHCFITLNGLFECGLNDDQVLIIAQGAPFAKKYVARGDIADEIKRVRGKWEENGGAQKDVEDESEAPEWADLLPISAPLYPVPEFDADTLLPEPLRTWIEDTANRMPCPTDYVAATAIVELGTVIGARVAIKPKSKDDWLVVPNLWGGIVGGPSRKKSPAINAAMKPLGALINSAKEAHEEAKAKYEKEKVVFDAKREAIEAEIKLAAKKEVKGKLEPKEKTVAQLAEELEAHDKTAPKKPIPRRYKSNDITVEKLGELLRDNPAGLLALRDELVGLLSSWDREGHEGDRAFFLEGWNGVSDFDTDRIGRGSIFIPNLCVSVFGGIQPDKLIRYLEQADRSLANDGMLPRFQMLVYPDQRVWEWRDQEPNKEARDRAYAVFETLADFDPVAWGATPADEFHKFPHFHFDEKAQETFIEWCRELYGERISAEDHILIEQHLGKYENLFTVLALIFHLVDLADPKTQNQTPAEVSETAADRAAAWCEYLEAHARRCYGLLIDDGLRAAQALADKIKKGKIADGFTAHQVFRNQWRYLTSKQMIEAALEWLEGSGWLCCREIGGTGPGGGKPTTRYWINPAVKKGEVA